MESIHPGLPTEGIPSSTHSQLPHHSASAPNFGLPFYTKYTNTHCGTPHTLNDALYPMNLAFSEQTSSTSAAEGDVFTGTVASQHGDSRVSIDFKAHSIGEGHDQGPDYDQVDTIHPGSHTHSHSPVAPLYGIGDLQFNKMTLVDPPGEAHCSAQEQIDRDDHRFRPAGERGEGKWSHLT